MMQVSASTVSDKRTLSIWRHIMLDFCVALLWNALWVFGIVVAICALLWAIGLLRGVKVKEATAVAFEFAGAWQCTVMQFYQHHFRPNGDVVSDSNPLYANERKQKVEGNCRWVWRIIGGWVVYLSPLVQPAKYADHNVADGFGEDIHIRLGDISINPKVLGQKTVDPENILLNVDFVGVQRILNPRKNLYNAPPNVNVQLLKWVEAGTRTVVASHNQEFIQGSGGDGKKIWKGFTAHKGFASGQQRYSDWGTKLVEDSLTVDRIGYTDPGYAKKLAAQAEEKLQARADVEGSAGRTLLAVARLAGIDIDNEEAVAAFMKKIADDPSLLGKPAVKGGYKEMYETATDQWNRSHSTVVDNRYGTTKGGEIDGNLAAALAFANAWGTSRGGGR